jgi:hypothetical protein
MKTFFVLCSSLMVACAFAANEAPGTKKKEQAAEVYRPEAGKFPDLEKAYTYRGELVFVDHVNRRGSLRVLGVGVFRRNDPHPFAMLPYGSIRYHGAPADLRDIPLGTILHVTAYLPPDPKLSSVPVLPVDSKDRDANHYRGIGVFPAENHVLLLEVWRRLRQRLGRAAPRLVIVGQWGRGAEQVRDMLARDPDLAEHPALAAALAEQRQRLTQVDRLN